MALIITPSQVPKNTRSPCSGSEPLTFPGGGCFDHYKLSDSSLPIWKNTTKVENYAAPYSPPISPYARWHLNNPAGTNCEPDDPTCCDYSTNSLPCCDLPDPSEIVTSDPLRISQGVYSNCFTQSKDTSSFSSCNKIGYKSVIAKKNWHGRLGYHTVNNFPISTFDWCCACDYAPYQPNPDNTKYLGMSGRADYSFTTNNSLAGTSVTLTGFAQETVHVDKLTGKLIIDSVSSGSSDPTDNTLAADLLTSGINDPISSVKAGLAAANLDIQAVGAYWCSIIESNANLGSQPDVVSGGGLVWHIEYHDADPCGISIPRLIMDLDLSVGTIEVKTYSKDPCSDCAYYLTSDEVIAFSPTALIYTLVAYFRSASCNVETTQALSVNASLSDPYTAEQLKADVVNLLDKWDLTDDTEYPWRTDTGNFGRCPLVCYDELPTTLTQIGFPVSPDDGDPHTGFVLGAPAKVNADFYWDFAAENWATCTDIATGGDQWYIHTYGAASTEINVPRATHWTTLRQQQDFPQGAFISFNNFYTIPLTGDPFRISDETLWASKWAETKLVWESYDYARPCGKDRFEVSGSTATCIDSIASHVLTVDDASRINNGDTCIVGGTPLDGMWTVSSDHVATITLNTELATSSITPILFPTGSSGEIAAVRWHNIPPICGHLDISSVVVNNDKVTCSLAERSYLIPDDQVRVLDSVGYTQLTNVSVIDPFTVGLLTAHTSSNPNITLQFLESTSGPNWGWHDTEPKGDFTVTTWDYNFRDFSEWNRLVIQSQSMGFNCVSTPCSFDPGPPFSEPRINQLAFYGLPQQISRIICSQSCLPVNPCSPAVICISPNHEKFVSGQTFGMDFTNFKADSIYGAYWQSIPVQAMQDPLWTQPPVPCPFPCFTWEEDPGLCFGDSPGDSCFYAHAPMYESRCSVPSGAPSLPPGVSIGCKDVDWFNVPGRSESPCFPPLPDILYTDPVGYFRRASSCVCNHGRFSDQYSANGIPCIFPTTP